MAKPRKKIHKIHKKDDRQIILLMAYILRLRVQPLLTYDEIADLIITKLNPDTVPRFAKKCAPKEARPTFDESAIRPWLTTWLEQAFDLAESNAAYYWVKARDWDENRVAEILRVTGLTAKYYTVMGEEEMKWQIQWRKDGDWRAGSEPLGRPSEVDIESPTWRAITPPTRVAAILPVKSSSEEHA